MKITVFGLTISSSWGNGHATPYRAIFRALHRRGHQVHFFEKDVPYYRARRDFDACDYCRLTLYPSWDQARSMAIEEARDSDVVMTASYLPEGQRISDEILGLSGPLRVFYDLDTPVTLKNIADGETEYVRRDQLPAFDLLLSFTGGAAIRELEETYGARMVRPLYGCVDPDVYVRTPAHPGFTCDLSYMGTYAADRQSQVEELFLAPARRNPQKQFVLAGPLYQQESFHAGNGCPENIRWIEHVGTLDHPRFYSSSRITLNLTRGEMARNGWCPSGRFFEAAACGTPILSDWWEGLDTFFDVVHDLRIVSRAEHVESALNMPEAELQALAQHARQRVLEDHTGEVRAGELLRYLEEARSSSLPRPIGSPLREAAL
ncbi:MAG TPA: glycosyltransferase [Candidatus Angelobacter sp.]|nr:glycosyltransferase [Candidatus Angelobacter sp.]